METGYDYKVYKSFNTVVLKRPGLTEKYLFQESNIVVITKASKHLENCYFYYFYYFPDKNEHDTKIEILLPNSQTVHYTDTQHPYIANAKEMEYISSKIERFTNLLEEYNTLHLQELNYPAERESNFTAAFLGLGLGIPFLLTESGQGSKLEQTGAILIGSAVVTVGIVGLFTGISGFREVKSKRKELKRLESNLNDMINTK
jgi:hypothetical protein